MPSEVGIKMTKLTPLKCAYYIFLYFEINWNYNFKCLQIRFWKKVLVLWDSYENCSFRIWPRNIKQPNICGWRTQQIRIISKQCWSIFSCFKNLDILQTNESSEKLRRSMEFKQIDYDRKTSYFSDYFL